MRAVVLSFGMGERAMWRRTFRLSKIWHELRSTGKIVKSLANLHTSAVLFLRFVKDRNCLLSCSSKVCALIIWT